MGLFDNFFGGGKQGDYYKDEYLDQLNSLTGNQFRQALASGDINQAQNLAQRSAMATDPILGSRLAAQEVQNNPLTRSLFGAGGLQSRLGDEEGQLNTQGWKLNDQDRTAYGQSASDIARLFGQQEGDLARSLRARGLGGNAGAAAFSGLQGNKMEQLAQMQMQIANNRMENTRKRIEANRQLQRGLGQDAANMQQQQYGRQLSGADQYRQSMLDRGQIGAAQQQRQEDAFQDSVMGGLGKNLQATIQKAPQAAMAAGVTAMTGNPQAGAAASQASGPTVNQPAQKSAFGLDYGNTLNNATKINWGR